MSYVQQAQTAKRFAKVRVCRLLRSAAAAATAVAVAAFHLRCLRTPEPSRLGLPQRAPTAAPAFPAARAPPSPALGPPTSSPSITRLCPRSPPTQSAPESGEGPKRILTPSLHPSPGHPAPRAFSQPSCPKTPFSVSSPGSASPAWQGRAHLGTGTLEISPRSPPLVPSSPPAEVPAATTGAA